MSVAQPCDEISVNADARLLLDWCRPRGGRTGATASAGSGQPLNWHYVLRLASRHKVLPAVVRAIRTDPDLAVPGELRAQLISHAAGTARRNLVLAQDLIRIMDVLAAEDIAAIPIKGPVWAMALHGDLALRQFSDLDIMIDPADAVRAKRALLADGFSDAKILPSALYRSFALVSHDGVVQLDVQWGLLQKHMNAPLPFAGLHQRRQSVKILSREVAHPCPDDLLRVLCLYCVKEVPWVSLSYLRDIAVLLERHPDFDWDAVFAAAKGDGMLRIVKFALFLAVDLLSVRLPARVLARIGEASGLADLAASAKRRMFVDLELRRAAEHLRFADHLEKTLYHARVRERFRDMARPFAYLPIRADFLRPVRPGLRLAAGRMQRRIETR